MDMPTATYTWLTDNQLKIQLSPQTVSSMKAEGHSLVHSKAMTAGTQEELSKFRLN